MYQPFNLLLLPTIPFDIIYDHFSYSSLISLSACSERMNEIMRNSERVLRKRTTCHVIILHKIKTIHLQRGNGEQFEVGTVDLKSEQQRRIYRRIWFERKVGGVDWKLTPTRIGWAFFSCNEEEDFLFWVEYLKKLFNYQLTKIRMVLSPSDDFDKLLVKSDLLHVADSIYVSNFEHVTAFQMTHMLDHFVAKTMCIGVWTPKEYAYRNLINKFRHLQLSDGHWLRVHDIWSMAQTCARIHIQNFKCTSKSLNWFIKQWLESDNKTLELFRFQKPPANRHLDHAVVFEGIEIKPVRRKWWEKIKTNIVPTGELYGMDIRRKDGLLATVSLQTSRRPTTGPRVLATIFLVWTEPFPKCLLEYLV